MFTNIPDSVKSIRVLDHRESCLSDHFGISFDINFSVRRKKQPKKKVYNYSKANWKELNYDLKRVDWDNLIGSFDTHSAWPVFKNILKSLCDKHIPKRNVRSEFQPPWYDSACEKILKKKEKFRKNYKLSNNMSDLNKFRQCRRDFKHVMNEKMRLSVEDSDDTAFISKKNVLDNLPFNTFWYTLNETIIEYVNSHTDLGVTLNPKLLMSIVIIYYPEPALSLVFSSEPAIFLRINYKRGPSIWQ